MLEYRQPWAPAEIVRRHKEGQSANCISREMKITAGTVRRVLQKAGVYTARNQRPQQNDRAHLGRKGKLVDAEAAWAAYSRPGASLKSVGRQFNVSHGVMRSVLCFANRKVRSPKEQRQWERDTLTKEQKAERSRAGSQRYARSRSPEIMEAMARTKEATQSKASDASLRMAKSLAEFSPVVEMAVSRYNIDLGFPHLRVAVELDGGSFHHLNSVLLRRDQKKEALLRALGFLVIRIDGEEEIEYLRQWLRRVQEALRSTPTD